MIKSVVVDGGWAIVVRWMLVDKQERSTSFVIIDLDIYEGENLIFYLIWGDYPSRSVNCESPIIPRRLVLNIGSIHLTHHSRPAPMNGIYICLHRHAVCTLFGTENRRFHAWMERWMAPWFHLNRGGAGWAHIYMGYGEETSQPWTKRWQLNGATRSSCECMVPLNEREPVIWCVILIIASSDRRRESFAELFSINLNIQIATQFFFFNNYLSVLLLFLSSYLESEFFRAVGRSLHNLILEERTTPLCR